MSRRIWSGLFIAFLAGVLTATPTVQAQTTWYVDDDAPNDPCPGDPNCGDPLEDGSAEHPFDAIQEGIDATTDGDTVLVLDGTYTGDGNRDLDFNGKAMTVGSENGPAGCIMDCQGNGRGFDFHSGETAEAVVSGLTVTGGSAGNGGALASDNGSNPTIMSCIFAGNIADNGGGAYCNQSSPLLVNCLITGNTANTKGGGVLCQTSSATIVNCTITANDGSNGGGGIQVAIGSDITIANCIFSGNTADEGPEIRVLGPSGPSVVSISYSDVVGGQTGVYVDPACTLNWEDGMIDADPQLEDGVHLTTGSPCVDAGTNVPPSGLPETDIEGTPRPLDGDGDDEPWSGQAETADIGADELGTPIAPHICLCPREFEFVAVEAGPDPPSQVLTVWNCGVGTLQWEATATCGWLDAVPANGNSAGEPCEIVLSVDISNLGHGHHACALEIVDPAAANSPRTVLVDLYIGGAELRVPDEYPTIQAAIDAALPLDVILLADGIYTGDGNKNLDCAGKPITVRSANGPEACIIDCEGEGRAFYFHTQETPQTVVDGITIRGGYANGTGENRYGGAVFCSASSPMITRCAIESNRARELGGAIYCSNSNVTITECSILENEAEPYGSSGGGVYCASGSPYIVDCVIRGNVGDQGYGGGIRATATTVIEGCLVENNENQYGGGIYNAGTVRECTLRGNRARSGSGGGICGAQDVLNCTISENYAFHGGGGVASIGEISGSRILNNESPMGAGGVQGATTILDSDILGNAGEDGGGVRVGSGCVLISGCTIAYNVAEDWGGGLHLRDGACPVVENCVIAENTATEGGGVHATGAATQPTLRNCAFRWNGASFGAGLLAFGNSAPAVMNCTFSNNSAESHGGAICSWNASPIIANCVLWNDSAPQGPEASITNTGTLAVAYCDVEGGTATIYVEDNCTLEWGEGNIDIDPLLICDGVHVQAGSPCVEAGDPATDVTGLPDFDGEPRLAGERVDIGPDEFLDDDADDLADWWEIEFFGSPDNADPGADDDGDGIVNLDEYALCRNPLMAPAVYYVANGGDDSWDGLAPEWDGTHGPKATIESAIDQAHPYEGDEVVLMPGTYAGEGNRDLRFYGKRITVRGTDPEDPDIVAATVIDCEASIDDRHRGFTFDYREESDSVLAGLTMINGYGPEEYLTYSYTVPAGGGVFCDYSSPTIQNCVFTANSANGAGICCRDSAPQVIGCSFVGNTWGRPVYVLRSDAVFTNCTVRANPACGMVFYGPSEAAVIGCTLAENSEGGITFGSPNGSSLLLTLSEIHDNTGDNGAGVSVTGGGSVHVTDCVITRNEAQWDGGGIYAGAGANPVEVERCVISENNACNGGGVLVENNRSLILRDCLLEANWTRSCSPQGGGGLKVDFESDATAPVNVIRCTFRNNDSGRGGGAHCTSTTTFLNCAFIENHAGRGAGICGSPTVLNAIFLRNSATRGGAIYGGGTYTGAATIINSTMADNTASMQGGAYFAPTGGESLLENCILWANTAASGAQVAVEGVASVSYCDLQGGEAAVYVEGNATLNWNEGNIDAQPRFVSLDDDNVRLGAESPCIDAADNTAVPPDIADLDGDGDTDEPTPFDLDGNPRFVDDPATDDTGNGTPPIVDMGAYEFQAAIVAYLDIKPGSCPNPLNIQSHGVLPAAIVGTAEFDVTQIDVDTLVLTRADGVGGGVTPLMGPPGPGIHVDDVATPFDGEPCDCHDLGTDGIDDLTMKFDTEMLVTELQLADLPGGTSVELVISGQLLDGTQFAGTDCITLRPLGSQSGAGLGAVDQDERTPQTASERTTVEPQETERQEAEQEAFATPATACGLLSPAFLPVAIAGISVVRHRRRRGRL
jgi:predicted outer membrane repeat protein